jgi:AcrR family transcriptional regulator
MSSTKAPTRRPSRRRRVPRAEREAQLVEIALNRFARAGFQGVSVDVVAAEAGVTKPMVYSYFGSKEGLFIACAELAADRLAEALRRSAEQHTDAEERMWYGCVEVFRFIEEHRAAWAVLYAPETPGGPFGEPAAKATEAIAGLITVQFAETASAQGIVPAAQQHLEPLAHAFVHATIGLGRWWLEHPGEPRELQALRLMNFSWMGFGGMAQGQFWVPPAPSTATREETP